jgi:hypothetical protein
MTDFENQNSQNISSIVKWTNDEVLNHAEDVALGSLYQAVSHAMSLGALNAAAAQQQSDITAQAVVTMGATTLYSVVTASDPFLILNQTIPVTV